MTDSSCDLPQEMADRLGLEVLPLEVMADGKNYRNWLDGREIGFKEFYKLVREGKGTQDLRSEYRRFRGENGKTSQGGERYTLYRLFHWTEHHI